jgi:hypothetical protein
VVKNHKRTIVTIVSSVLLILLEFQVQGVYAAESASQNNMQLFLDNVMQIDLRQYNITQSGYDASYPEQYGGLVKEEAVSYMFTANDGSRLDTNALFENGLFTTCSLAVFNGKIVYKQTPTGNIIDQAKSLLQNYKNYIHQNYAADASYIQPAQSLLNGVSTIVTSNITADNMQLSISQTSKPNVAGSYIHLKWSHIENGTVIPRMSISMDFRDQTLVGFGDTLGIFKVGCLSSISKEEALQLGFAAAKNYNVTLVSFGENKKASAIQVEPDWSNYTYDISLAMIPGDSAYGKTANPPSGSDLQPVQLRYQSNVTRDPLALYPLWKMEFYFSKSIGSIYGIQVGIWGDSKEISYCLEATTLGNPSPSLTPTTTHTFSPQSSQGSSNGLLGSSFATVYGCIAICAIVAIIAVGSYLVIRRRK